MNKVIKILLIILTVAFFMSIVRSDFLVEQTVPMCDSSFLVLDSKTSKKSAMILCDVSKRLDRFMEHLHQFAGDREVDQLLKRYNSMKIVESSDSAYTINKAYGHFDKIHLCLQKSNYYFDIDTVMFVAIHELTHVMRPDLDIIYDHPREFWVSNKFLLKEAEKAGVMHNINYAATPVNYCAKLIASNPVFMDF